MSESEDFSELEGMESDEEEIPGSSKTNAKEHAEQLERLRKKDPEFYEYLKEFDKELLNFSDMNVEEDVDDDGEVDLDEAKDEEPCKEEQKPIQKVITPEMIDTWIMAAKDGKIGAIRSILRAFRTACHYGDVGEDGSAPRLHVMTSNVFNKVMIFVLTEMDQILRQVLNAPSFGGKRETILELMTMGVWKKHGSLMRLYLGNALHILREMIDEQMITFTIKRVKESAVFLAAFPSLLRKYIRAVLHTFETGRGALSVVSLLFLRDICVCIGSECLEPCLKGVCKAFASNCKVSKSVSDSKIQHIQFLINCVTELYGVDPPVGYQHAFSFIRQLAEELRAALTQRGPKVSKEKNKDNKQKQIKRPTKKQIEKAYQKVYDWQYIFRLELWTGIVCAHSSEEDFRPLAYPLAQIIHGVACLVPTARYFPLRLRCVRMLNRIAKATGTFIPVSSLLLDMLEMKELKEPPTGGVGKAVQLPNTKQVDKTTLKTRSFQESCIYAVIDEMAEHLAQWSYSVAFYELSFIPLVRLRSFCKRVKADRFRKEIKDLIRQVVANIEFTNSRRIGVSFSPNDPTAESFLKEEMESECSPLSKFVANLQARARNRKDTIVETSVIVGKESSVFTSKLSDLGKEEDGEDVAKEGGAVFSSSWMPERKILKTAGAKKKKEIAVAEDEDIVVDYDSSDGNDDFDVYENEEVGSGNDFLEEDDNSKKASAKAKVLKRNLLEEDNNSKKASSKTKVLKRKGRSLGNGDVKKRPKSSSKAKKAGSTKRAKMGSGK